MATKHKSAGNFRLPVLLRVTMATAGSVKKQASIITRKSHLFQSRLQVAAQAYGVETGTEHLFLFLHYSIFSIFQYTLSYIVDIILL